MCNLRTAFPPSANTPFSGPWSPARRSEHGRRVATIVSERERLGQLFAELPQVRAVYPSQTNFLLMQVADADRFTAAARAGGYLAAPDSRRTGARILRPHNAWHTGTERRPACRIAGLDMSARIAFIDRDGTLILEPPDEQVDSLNKLRLAQGVIPALGRLRGRRVSKLVIVSNQDGLGSETFPMETYRIPHDFLIELLASQGIQFSEVFVCPHQPGEGCDCRKPLTGLVNAFMSERRVDRAASVMIGDRDTDLAFAENLGVRGFLVDAADPDSWNRIARQIVDAPRIGRTERTTRETSIRVEIDLDAAGGGGRGYRHRVLRPHARATGEA